MDATTTENNPSRRKARERKSYTRPPSVLLDNAVRCLRLLTMAVVLSLLLFLLPMPSGKLILTHFLRFMHILVYK